MNKHYKFVVSGFLFLGLLMMPALSFMSANSAWAHGDQLGADESDGAAQEEEKGPHGGSVVVFGESHLEFTVDHASGEIILYLLDKDLNAIPMPENYTGVIYINLADGSKKTVDLERGTEGPVSHLEADTDINEIGQFKAVVSIKYGEQHDNFRFSWTPDAHALGDSE
jgi:hypothetical protein